MSHWLAEEATATVGLGSVPVAIKSTKRAHGRWVMGFKARMLLRAIKARRRGVQARGMLERVRSRVSPTREGTVGSTNQRSLE